MVVQANCSQIYFSASQLTFHSNLPLSFHYGVLNYSCIEGVNRPLIKHSFKSTSITKKEEKRRWVEKERKDEEDKRRIVQLLRHLTFSPPSPLSFIQKLDSSSWLFNIRFTFWFTTKYIILTFSFIFLLYSTKKEEKREEIEWMEERKFTTIERWWRRWWMRTRDWMGKDSGSTINGRRLILFMKRKFKVMSIAIS